MSMMKKSEINHSIEIGPPVFQMSMSKGIVGLTNIGNTCYGNATLQALRHQVDFTIYILQNQHADTLKRKPSSEKTKLLECYASLLKSLWTAPDSVSTVSTREFWTTMIPAAIKEGFEQFRIAAPHDSHEFLVFLLDQFHEALSEEVTMTIRQGIMKPDITSALEFWKSSFEKKYSPLVELLFFLRRKGVVCSQCKNESVSWETLNITKLCVKSDSTDLLELMKDDCKGEEIDEYHCLKCPKRTKATVSYAYWRLGNWVIITLKRNENNGKKITANVNIPKELTFNTIFHPSSEETSATATYELFSTIEHHGSSRGGHYTSHAKHPITGKWIFYNDETGVEVPDVTINSSVYTVMYRKVTEKKAATAQ